MWMWSPGITLEIRDIAVVLLGHPTYRLCVSLPSTAAENGHNIDTHFRHRLARPEQGSILATLFDFEQ